MHKNSLQQQRLHSLFLLRSSLERAEDVVSTLAAVQAQDFSGAKWGVGLRMREGSDAAVEAAFADGRILRTHALRPTWHFVVPADIKWMLMLTAPRVLAASAGQFRKLELDASVFRRTTRALERALAGGHQLDRSELRAVLERAGVATEGDLRMSYILMHAELHAIVCSGARRGKQFTYTLLDERAPHARTLSVPDAVAELASRYFATRGPATVHDFAKWSGLTVAMCKTGLEACQPQLEKMVVEGNTYWHSPQLKTAEVALPVTHLLSIYDEYVSSYRHRNAAASNSDGAKLLAMGNALTGIATVNGVVAGTWKRVLQKESLALTITPLRKTVKAERQRLAANAQQYAQFFGMDLEFSFGS